MGEWIGWALNLLPLVAFEAFLVFIAVRRRLLLSSLVATHAVMFLGGVAVALTFHDVSVLPPLALLGSLGVGVTAVIQSRVTPVPAPTLPLAELRPEVLEGLERRLVDVGRALEGQRPLPWMPLRMTASAEVLVPPTALSEYLHDLDRWGEYSNLPSRTVQTSQGPWRVGATYRTDFAYTGSTLTMVGRVAVCDPPGLCRTVSVSAVSFCVSDTVIEETAGGSQVRLRQRLGYRSGFQTAMAVLTYPLQILVFRWELRVVTRRLKRAAEAHYQATLEGAR